MSPQPHAYSDFCTCYDCRNGNNKPVKHEPKTVTNIGATPILRMVPYIQAGGKTVILACYDKELPESQAKMDEDVPVIRIEIPTQWIMDLAFKFALMVKQG